ncbi:hypothetical protein AB6D11_00440 [Vibrio splendidus]
MFQSFMFHPKKGITVSQSYLNLELTVTFGFSLQLPQASLALMDMRDVGRQTLASLCHSHPEWSKSALDKMVKSYGVEGVVQNGETHSINLVDGDKIIGVWGLKGDQLHLNLYTGRRGRMVTGTDLDAIILLRSFLTLIQSLLDSIKLHHPVLFETAMSKHWIRRRQFLSVA